MSATIENPAKYYVFGVIRFMMTKHFSLASIPRKLCPLYGQTIMSESVLHQCVCLLKGGRTNIKKKTENIVC